MSVVTLLNISGAWHRVLLLILPDHNTIEFFLPVTIVVIPDVLVTNLITKLY